MSPGPLAARPRPRRRGPLVRSTPRTAHRQCLTRQRRPVRPRLHPDKRDARRRESRDKHILTSRLTPKTAVRGRATVVGQRVAIERPTVPVNSSGCPTMKREDAMAGPPRQRGTTRYLSFDARSIRDTGRCPRDPGGRTAPYPAAEVADLETAGPLAKWDRGLTCPVCGRGILEFTFIEVLSKRGSTLLRESLEQPSVGQAGTSASGAVTPQPPAPARGPSRSLESVRSRYLDPQRGSPPADQRAPATCDMRGATIVSIEAGKRRAEPIGSDPPTNYDRSQTSSSSTETLHITHSTQFAMRIFEESATLTGGGGSVALMGFAGISGTLEQRLLKHYSVDVTSTLTFERMSQMEVPAGKHVRVTLSWKRIWQDGVVSLRTRSGSQVVVPYSLTVDLSYDQKVVDVS